MPKSHELAHFETRVYFDIFFEYRPKFLDSFLNEPCHEIMSLFVLRKLILQTAHAQSSSGARCLIFGRAHRLLPYFMCANSKGSGETARMRRLA